MVEDGGTSGDNTGVSLHWRNYLFLKFWMKHGCLERRTYVLDFTEHTGVVLELNPVILVHSSDKCFDLTNVFTSWSVSSVSNSY